MRAIAALLAVLALPAAAHEFWIHPTDYTPAADEATAANIRVGEDFSGSAYAYFPRSITRFEVVANGEVRPVEGTIGDRPAMAETVLPEGLNVIVHETGDNTITYTELEKFQNFARHKDFLELAPDDTELPVREVYRRFAKSLIGVGSAEGADAPTGMRAELVALDNPYVDDLADGLRVRLLEEGAPVPGTQVEVFARRGDSVEVTTVRTDGDGVATVPVEAGTEYMLDSVLLRPTPADETSDWISLWANLTFAVPG